MSAFGNISGLGGNADYHRATARRLVTVMNSVLDEATNNAENGNCSQTRSLLVSASILYGRIRESADGGAEVQVQREAEAIVREIQRTHDRYCACKYKGR